MDEWSTLEVAKTSFDGINWNDYRAIRFYSEANRTDYVINVLTKWGDGGKLGDQTTMTMTNEYAELSLEGIDMAARLDTDRLMVQCNKEGGNPFNFTAIVLVKKESTGIKEIENGKLNIENADGVVFDLQGRRMESSMFNLQSSILKKGMYIVNGKKYIFK